MNKVLTVVVALTSMVLITACEPTASKPPSAQQSSEKARQASVKNVMEATKTPILEISLDRENIAKRIDRSNDRNHIQWMYLFGNTGAVIERFAVIGKVTSGGKRLNAKYSYRKYSVDTGQYSRYNRFRTEEPDEMGTYGSSSPYIFWFDLDGTMVQTNLPYLILDKPVNIKGGVLRISDVDQKELQEKRAIEAELNKKAGK